MVIKRYFQNFFDIAKSKPEQVYLCVRKKPVTYASVISFVRAFAKMIRMKGWGGDTNTIAVRTDDPEQLFYTIWACVYSGTNLVFCPFCKDVSQARNAMAETGARALLTDTELLPQEQWMVSLNDIVNFLTGYNLETNISNAIPAPIETESAFIFQTSGTEGEPKWVECHYWKCFEVVECMWQEGALDHACEQVVFLTPPLFHSYGLSSLFEYTRSGSMIVLPTGASPLGRVGELCDHEIASQITAIEGVPDLHFQLSRLAARIKLPMLRHLGFGGGGLDANTIKELQKHYTDITYSVRYGLTETPSVVSHKVFYPPYGVDWHSSGPIMPIYQVEIIDETGKILGPEQEGEIVVKGECVAEYIGEARHDRKKNGLKTGDIGYLSHKGELVIVGRRSVFIKYRGYRLSPEQIESVIRSVCGIDDCRVMIRDSRLIAEIVLNDNALSKSELFIIIAEQLSNYSIPEELIQVDRIPRTSSGKIKRL